MPDPPSGLPAAPLPLQCTEPGIIPDYNSSLVFLDPLRGWMRGQTCLDGTWRAVLATTNDGGETWRALGSPGLPGGVLRFASPSDGWLLGERVLVTHDGGATWTEGAPLRNVQALERVGTDVWVIQGSCAVVGPCDYQLLISSDVGRTWQAATVQPEIAGYGARLVRAGPQDTWIISGGGELPRYLLATHDGGSTWQELSIPCTNSGGHVVAVDAAHLWFLCSSIPGAGSEPKWLYTSSDGGETWQLVAETSWPGFVGLSNMPMSGYAHHLAATSPERAFIGLGRGGLLLTKDGGRTWTRTEVPNVGDAGIWQVVFIDEQHGWAVVSLAIWRTQDGGDTWERLGP
jgi:photosystem II stability/assembly factor-like uncharacterized protein